MANRINTNLTAQFTQRLLQGTQGDIETRLRRLASAIRINAAADDAAGLAISERLEALERGFNRATENVQDASSAARVAEGGLEAIQGSVQRIRELAVQAANDTLTDQDRQLIQEEIDQLTAEIDRFAPTVTFNNQPLLTGQFEEGTGEFTVQAGAEEGETIALNFPNATTTALGISGIDVTTRAGAEAAITAASNAVDKIAADRARIGAQQNRLEQTVNFLGIARENTLASQSRIRDADFATEIIGLSIAQLREQSGTAALAQANLSPQNILALLG